jgi:hypothetical protein
MVFNPSIFLQNFYYISYSNYYIACAFFLLWASQLAVQSSLNLYNHATRAVSILAKPIEENLNLIKYYSNNKYEYLAYYLAGLIEGDGHLNTPPIGKVLTPSGSNRVAQIEIVFSLKDRPSADLLQSIFGGRVYLRKDIKIVR